MTVKLGDRSYPIGIGADAVPEALKCAAGRPVLAVADAKVLEFHGERIHSLLPAGTGIVSLSGGEAAKDLNTVLAICREAARHKLDRSCVFLAFGGGVTGDLTGFAAAIYLRGVDFIQCPTSLLAMVDSSVGGKTGADLPEGKNLVGAFHQPLAVGMEPGFLKTLPPEELSNGLAEAVKTAAILDESFFRRLESLGDGVFTAGVPCEVIRRCCECKARIVAADETEQGIRAILNYGHTIGHAVERLSRYTLPHGAAVAIGMTAAARIARHRGMLTQCESDRQEKLLQAFRLPVRIPQEYSASAILDAMGNDKKARGGRPRFVLLRGLGYAEVVSDVSDEEIFRAIEEVRS